MTVRTGKRKNSLLMNKEFREFKEFKEFKTLLDTIELPISSLDFGVNKLLS